MQSYTIEYICQCCYRRCCHHGVVTSKCYSVEISMVSIRLVDNTTKRPHYVVISHFTCTFTFQNFLTSKNFFEYFTVLKKNNWMFSLWGCWCLCEFWSQSGSHHLCASLFVQSIPYPHTFSRRMKHVHNVPLTDTLIDWTIGIQLKISLYATFTLRVLTIT